MKILKIFGVVVGIHLFALILIFANPGCSSTKKPAPALTDTAPKPAETPAISVPSTASAVYSSGTATAASTPVTVAFNPDAPAPAATEAAPGVRFVPTRPGTPVAGALVTEPVTDVTPATTYAVKSGDNLWTIAKKNNLTIAQLTAANGLSASSTLQPGQKLIIPSKPMALAATTVAAKGTEATASTPAASSRPADAVRHTVKSGETLGVIARNYGVRQGDIAVANNISDPAKIRAGMELIIPGWQSTGTKSGKAGAKSPQGTASKSAEPKPAEPGSTPPALNLQPEPAPATPPPVPVIRIDDGPGAPAPKS